MFPERLLMRQGSLQERTGNQTTASMDTADRTKHQAPQRCVPETKVRTVETGKLDDDD